MTRHFSAGGRVLRAQWRVPSPSPWPPAAIPRYGARHELRRALRRPEGRRPEPGHRRPLLRHAAGPVRRRRHQGRGHRRRRLGAHARARATATIPPIRSSAISARRSIAVDLKTRGRQAGRCGGCSRAPTSSSKASGRASSSRLGFDYDAVAAREPRLLYLSISGFGQTGPLAERPAMDPVLQAYTGLMIENRGEDGIPHRVPVIVVDMSTALYAFQALSAALYARRDETRGRYIEASLMQAATALQSIRLMACHLEGGAMKPGGAPGGVFKIADGWMSIAGHQRPRLARPVRGDADAGAGRRSALRHAGRCGSPTTSRSTPSCGRRSRREPWAVWSKRLTEARPDARAAEQLRRVPGPAARARDRPDPVAHPGRLQPAGARSPPCPACCRQAEGTPRGTAPVTGQHTAGCPGRARLCRATRSTRCWRKARSRRHDDCAARKPSSSARWASSAATSSSRLLAEGDWQVVGLSRRPRRQRRRATATSPSICSTRKDVDAQAGRAEGRHAHLLRRLSGRRPAAAAGYASNIAPNRDMLVNAVTAIDRASRALHARGAGHRHQVLRLASRAASRRRRARAIRATCRPTTTSTRSTG